MSCYLRKYGVLLTTAKAVTFSLYEIDGIDLSTAATFAAGDVTISKDGGAEANTTNLPIDEGKGYSLILTLAELECSQARISIVDQTGTKVWLDIELIVETYGNASAMHAFDLGTSSVAQTADHTAAIADIPTNSELNARTLLAADYFDFTTDEVTIDATSVDLIWDEPLTGGTHNVATSSGRRLRGLQDFGNYLGAIHVDTINGTSGTVVDENGTTESPVLTWADALTLNATLGYNKFQISNGSTITLSANSDSYTILGENWTLVLNNQSIASAYFSGASEVTGVSSGESSKFNDCKFGSFSTGSIWASNCRLNGTFTALTSSTGYFFQSCFASTGTVPVINLTSRTSVVVCLTPLTGGVSIENSTDAGNLVHIEGGGEITINASSTAGDVEIGGDFTVTDNGSMTIRTDDKDTNIKAVLVDTGTSLPAQISGLNNFDPGVDLVLSNVTQINGTIVLGNGTPGNLWRG